MAHLMTPQASRVEQMTVLVNELTKFPSAVLLTKSSTLSCCIPFECKSCVSTTAIHLEFTLLSQSTEYSNDFVDYSGEAGTKMAFEQARVEVAMVEFDSEDRYLSLLCGNGVADYNDMVMQNLKAAGTWVEPPIPVERNKKRLECLRAWPWKWQNRYLNMLTMVSYLLCPLKISLIVSLIYVGHKGQCLIFKGSRSLRSYSSLSFLNGNQASTFLHPHQTPHSQAHSHPSPPNPPTPQPTPQSPPVQSSLPDTQLPRLKR
jgi:hypothetical protein